MENLKILVLDNYDSFTYNLVQYLQEIGNHQIEVFRNDEITLAEVEAYDAVVLSPGPGLPKDAGIMPELIKQYASTKPILGVCLGHQAIGEAFGGSLQNLKSVFHGLATPINVVAKDAELFDEMEKTVVVGRYHSWIIQKDNLPDYLAITAVDEANEIMAISHKTFPLKGVQFHPESILTPEGKQLLANFLNIATQYIQKQVAAGLVKSNQS